MSTTPPIVQGFNPVAYAPLSPGAIEPSVPHFSSSKNQQARDTIENINAASRAAIRNATLARAGAQNLSMEDLSAKINDTLSSSRSNSTISMTFSSNAGSPIPPPSPRRIARCSPKIPTLVPSVQNLPPPPNSY